MVNITCWCDGKEAHGDLKKILNLDEYTNFLAGRGFEEFDLASVIKVSMFACFEPR